MSAVEQCSGLVLLAEATPYSALLMREGLWRERALAAASALPLKVGPAAVAAAVAGGSIWPTAAVRVAHCWPICGVCMNCSCHIQAAT